ncbi:hypothetical protein IMZ48_22370 [Candidatus Bathyarchaeota archaeon]|nr:hypothetical protein [Candidatus Bathyarchaeota archaeon]
MDNNVDLNMANNTLRERASARKEDDDERQGSQRMTRQDTARQQVAAIDTGLSTAAQDDLTRAIAEGMRPIWNDTSPTLTPTMSTPQSMSPTPTADGCLANFGIVMPGIYRSAWPTREGFEFMRNLGLKTIMCVPLVFLHLSSV